MVSNDWPASNTNSPVYIRVLENAWGFYGAMDRTGYEVIYMGRASALGPFTNYDAAAVEASRLFNEHGRRILELEERESRA